MGGWAFTNKGRTFYLTQHASHEHRRAVVQMHVSMYVTAKEPAIVQQVGGITGGWHSFSVVANTKTGGKVQLQAVVLAGEWKSGYPR